MWDDNIYYMCRTNNLALCLKKVFIFKKKIMPKIN